MNEYERSKAELIQVITSLGHPAALGEAVAANLRTPKTMNRMISYLINVKPKKAEEIADEMLAIMSDRERWIEKKESEYYNSKYNDYLNSDLRESD
ncbi:hypothetical protein SAMN06296386_105216 [Lachnospiraceae bacterium]|nr:hypothetical protein SAMN06296386_105216 [Lachnospiraceae bacterium]